MIATAVLHMLLPYFDVEHSQDLAMRTAWGPELAVWDRVGAVVASYYWMRGGFGPCDASPQLCKDSTSRSSERWSSMTPCCRAWSERGWPSTWASAAVVSLRWMVRSRLPAEMITHLIGDENGNPAKRPLLTTPALVEHLPDADAFDDPDLRTNRGAP